MTTSPSLPLPLNLTEETAPHPSTPSMMGGGSLICSVGSSTRTWEKFLALLTQYGVQTVADVRRFPDRSRFEHFTRKKLEQALKEADLGYVFLGEELGGFRQEGYAAYTTTPAFQEGILRLEKIGHEARTAFLCAERLPWRCHRRFIGDELARWGWTVLHLIGEGKGIMAVPR